MIELFRHNLSLKIISFVLAVLVWGFTRAMDPVEERGLQLDVVVKLDPGVALSSRSPERNNELANVRGPSSRITRLVSGDPKAVLDARGMRPGETRIIQPRLEPNLRGIQADFENVFEITVDSYTRSTWVPEEITEGTLPAGFYIEARIGLPADVTVEGADTLVKKVSRVIYQLDLSGLQGSTEIPVVFQAVDANGSPITNLMITPSTATIGLSLQPSQASKVVPVVVDYQGTPASNYALTSLSSDPFMVEVSGPAESLVDVVNVRTEPINLTGKTGSFQQSVKLLQPNANVSLSTSTVNVRVAIEQLSGRMTFEGLMIELRGVDNTRYIYEIEPATVNVTISGGVDRVAEVTSGFVRPQVYLDNLEPGMHTLRVSVNVPSGVNLSSVIPAEVTVVISERSEPEETIPGDGTQPDGEGDSG